MSKKHIKLSPATRRIMEVMTAKASAEIERIRIEKDLRSMLKEKVVLVREVNHRVKNNLQIISSLIGLQCAEAKDEATLRILGEMNNRILAMALAHETLFNSDRLDTVRFRDYVEQFCNRLSDSMGPVGASLRMELRVHDIALPLEKTLPCGIILYELISSAAKHLFPDPAKKTIIVEFGPCEKSGMLRLRVRDNGTIPPGKAPVEDAASLGMQLISGLTRQLGGEVTFATDDGSCSTLEFPFPDWVCA